MRNVAPPSVVVDDMVRTFERLLTYLIRKYVTTDKYTDNLFDLKVTKRTGYTISYSLLLYTLL